MVLFFGLVFLIIPPPGKFSADTLGSSLCFKISKLSRSEVEEER